MLFLPGYYLPLEATHGILPSEAGGWREEYAKRGCRKEVCHPTSPVSPNPGYSAQSCSVLLRYTLLFPTPPHLAP